MACENLIFMVWTLALIISNIIQFAAIFVRKTVCVRAVGKYGDPPIGYIWV